MERVRVLVVDDSPTMRAVVKIVLKSDPAIEVVGEAGDPYEAREAIKLLNPDVLTLDIEMPRMSGLQFLEKIMKLRPMPVIMVSTLTQKGAGDTIESLRIGAFECVGKPVKGDFVKALAHLPELIKAAAKHKPKSMIERQNKMGAIQGFVPSNKVIAIGSSTGGVEALFTLLSGFPKNCPPTIITQHMPESFLVTFAERLNRSIEPNVSTAKDGDMLKQGHVYLAPGGDYHLELKGGQNPVCSLLASDPVSGHRPSVDVMLNSVSKNLGQRAVGIILTGMGRDGAQGLLSLRQAGGRTFGQDENSCVVYGMPKCAKELGGVEVELDITKISAAALAVCNANARAA